MNKVCETCIRLGICGFLMAAECPIVRKEDGHLEHNHPENRVVMSLKEPIVVAVSTDFGFTFDKDDQLKSG